MPTDHSIDVSLHRVGRETLSASRRAMLLSIGASLVTMALKFTAYFVTGSVGLLSDAAESLVNLATALIAYAALAISDRPPDEEHTYGHDKVQYFSSGAEGTLILVAAATIIYTAVQRLLNPAPLERLGVGAGIALAASGVNLVVAQVMLRVAKKHDSIAVEADAHHLMTDVWTSVGVVVGVALVGLTGWLWLDPLIAIAVALNIVWMGVSLIRRSVQGLMDYALPPEEVAEVQQAIADVAGPDTPYHGLRSRKAGARRFIDFHLLLPGKTTVQEAHDLAEEIDRRIEERLSNTYVTIHIEPREDEASWDGHRVGGISGPG